MKYMVVECQLSYAVVLDEQGRFLKVANKHYEVGQMVTDVEEMQIPTQSPAKKPGKWIYSAAAVAACLLLAFGMMFRLNQSVYASVYMSINPQVRIDVNRKDMVVGLAGTNVDGQTLIVDYDYRQKGLDLVMDELVDLAIALGYLHEGSKITLTLDAQNQEWVVGHTESLPTHMNEHLSEITTITIEVVEQIPADRDQSGMQGDSKYGDSDYGWTDYSETIDINGKDEGNSPYDGKTEGDSQYNESLDSTYDGSDSPYDDKTDSTSRYGEISDSRYDGGDSPYDDKTEGDSRYDETSDSAYEEGDSMYGVTSFN